MQEVCVPWLEKNRDFWKPKVNLMEDKMSQGAAKGTGQDTQLPPPPFGGIELMDLSKKTRNGSSDILNSDPVQIYFEFFFQHF